MKFSAIYFDRMCMCSPLNRSTIRIVCAYYLFSCCFFLLLSLSISFVHSLPLPFNFVFLANLPVYWVKWIQAWNWVYQNGNHMYGTFFFFFFFSYHSICFYFFFIFYNSVAWHIECICVRLMRSHSKWQSAYTQRQRGREITFNFKSYMYTSHCHSAHVWFSWASSNRTAKASFSLKGLHCYASWTR